MLIYASITYYFHNYKRIEIEITISTANNEHNSWISIINNSWKPNRSPSHSPFPQILNHCAAAR